MAADGGAMVRRNGTDLWQGGPDRPCRYGIMRPRSGGHPLQGHPRRTCAVCHRHRFGGSHWTHPIVKHIFTCLAPQPAPAPSPRQRVAARKSPSKNEYPTPQISERMPTTSARRGGKESGTRVPDSENAEAAFPTGGFWRFVATRLFLWFGKRLPRPMPQGSDGPRQILATLWHKTPYMRAGNRPIMTMKGVQNPFDPSVSMCQYPIFTSDHRPWQPLQNPLFPV